MRIMKSNLFDHQMKKYIDLNDNTHILLRIEKFISYFEEDKHLKIPSSMRMQAFRIEHLKGPYRQMYSARISCTLRIIFKYNNNGVKLICLINNSYNFPYRIKEHRKVLSKSSAYKKAQKKLPKFSHYLNYISKYHWPFLNIELFKDRSSKQIYHTSNKELYFIYKKVLFKRSNYILNLIFKKLESNLGSIHAKQIKMIRYILFPNCKELNDLKKLSAYKNKSNEYIKNIRSNYYVLFFNIIFSMFGYLSQFRKIETGNTLTAKNSVRSDESKFSKDIKTKITQLDKISAKKILLMKNTYDVLSYFYRHISFNKFDYDKMPFGRNSIVHGVYDPYNFSKKYISKGNNIVVSKMDFIKLIILLKNYSIKQHYHINIKKGKSNTSIEIR